MFYAILAVLIVAAIGLVVVMLRLPGARARGAGPELRTLWAHSFAVSAILLVAAVALVIALPGS